MSKHPCHKKNLVSLKRIEGQVRGIQNMIESGKYCVDILTQINAIKGALTRVEGDILQRHLDHCVTEAMASSSAKERQKKLDEIISLMHQTKKSYK